MLSLSMLLVAISIAMITYTLTALYLTETTVSRQRPLGILRPKLRNNRIMMLMEKIGSLRRVKTRELLDDKLTTAGHPMEMNVNQLLGVQIVLPCLLALLSIPAAKTVGYLLPLSLVVGWIYPGLWLDDRIRKRQQSIREQLPFTVDLLSVCVEAGLNFDGALSKVVEVAPKNDLSEELAMVLRGIRMGQSRRDALTAMAKRTRLSEAKSLVSTLVQADQLGTGIGAALPILADQMRTRRLLAAEATATKAPVKMLFPLVALVFPCILLILFAPILMSGAINF